MECCHHWRCNPSIIEEIKVSQKGDAKLEKLRFNITQGNHLSS